MIGKFSELPYHTKSPPGGMRTRANGRGCLPATALGAGIPLCGILFVGSLTLAAVSAQLQVKGESACET